MKQTTVNQILMSVMAMLLVVNIATAQTNSPVDRADVMRELIGKPFRTFDRNSDGNDCASRYGGAWWFGDDCARVNLHGDFEESGRPGVWYGVPLDANKIVKMEMKIRPME